MGADWSRAGAVRGSVVVVDDLPPRIRQKVELDGDCWIWIAARNAAGYGKLYWDSRYQYAHRVVYELLVDPIPSGYQIDHYACGRTSCVNPEHVRPVTPRENVLRAEGSASAVARAKTHCLNGHPLVEGNLDKMSDGIRRCSTCRRARVREYDKKRRMA